MYHTQRSKQERLHLPLSSAALRDKGRRRIRPGGSVQADTSSSVLCSELTQTAERLDQWTAAASALNYLVSS